MKHIGTFIMAFISFALTGWIGWLGIILCVLKLFGVIKLSWLLTLIPFEYGIIYCLYMVLDGISYKNGSKGAGLYARYTQGYSKEDSDALQIQLIINQGPSQIAKSIDKNYNNPTRIDFIQSLIDMASIEYSLKVIAELANPGVNPYSTLEKWEASGLKIPENID